MQLVHLGLPVRDVERSVAFYADYFGFDPATASRCPDGTVIVRDASRFDLALHPDEPAADAGEPAGTAGRPVGPLHAFLHAGFRVTEPGAVRALLTRMRGDGVPITESHDEPGYVAFKCADPDGHRVEVYWEA